MKKVFALFGIILWIFGASALLIGNDQVDFRETKQKTFYEIDNDDSTNARSYESTVFSNDREDDETKNDRVSEYIFFDDGVSLRKAGWDVDGRSPLVGIFDHASNLLDWPIPENTYGIFSKAETGIYASIHRSMTFPQDGFVFEMDMAIHSLITPTSNHSQTGVSVELIANGVIYTFVINDVGRLYVHELHMQEEKPLIYRAMMGETVKRWRFEYHGNQTIRLYIDDRLIGVFEGPWPKTDHEQEGLTIRNVPQSVLRGQNRVIVDKMAVRALSPLERYERMPKIAYVNRLPNANDADGFLKMTVGIQNMQAEQIVEWNMQLVFRIYEDDECLYEMSMHAYAKDVYAVLSGIERQGLLQLKVVLKDDKTVYDQVEKPIRTVRYSKEVTEHSRMFALPRTSYVYRDFQKWADVKEAGWTLLHYTYHGDTTVYTALDGNFLEQELAISVEPIGHFDVYIGYIKGCSDILLDWGDGPFIVPVDDTKYIHSYEIGESYVAEVFAGSKLFMGETLVLRPVIPGKLRIAYIRFVSAAPDDRRESDEPGALQDRQKITINPS